MMGRTQLVFEEIPTEPNNTNGLTKEWLEIGFLNERVRSGSKII